MLESLNKFLASTIVTSGLLRQGLVGALVLELEHQEDGDSNKDDETDGEPDHPGGHRAHVRALLLAGLVIMNRPGMVIVSNILP